MSTVIIVLDKQTIFHYIHIMNNTLDIDSKPKYGNIIQRLLTSRGTWETRAKKCEEFFYKDVEGTGTQFTKEQLSKIKSPEGYDIDVSIDVLFPTIEQMIAFLTGNKPSVRIMPVGNADKNTSYILNEIFSAIYYKSNGLFEIRKALYDSLITGSGFVMAEPNGFYNQNIFDVNIIYVPWQFVYVDPNSTRWDFQDAEYILVAKSISKEKFKKEFGKWVDGTDVLDFGSNLGGGITNDFQFTQIGDNPVTIYDLYMKEYVKKPGFLSLDGKITSAQAEGSLAIEPGVYVRRVMLYGNNKVMWDGILPLKEYPIIHFPCVHNKSPKTYGIVHFLMDCQQAINKFLALSILNAQTHSNAKIMAVKGQFDPDEFYKNASDPRKLMEYESDPSNPTNIPQRLQPVPLSQAFYTLFEQLLKMVELISGIYSVMQGSPDNAPSTFGGTQSLQNYGTQRMRLKATTIDMSNAKLAHCIVQYVIFYSDKGKIWRYIDDSIEGYVQDPQTGEMKKQMQKSEEPWREMKLLEKPNINDYDVVALPNPSTPTTRMMASQLLGTIAGQSADPAVGQLLTQYALKLMDIPEADEIVKKVDIIQQMKQQLEQLQKMTQELQGQVQSTQADNMKLQENLVREQVKHRIEKEAIHASAEVETQTQLATQEIGHAQENLMPEEEQKESIVQ